MIYNLKKRLFFNYIFDKNFLLYFDKVNNLLYFYNNYLKSKIYLPNFYLNKNLYFIFFDKYKFISFLKIFLNKIKYLNKFYFFRLKLKGLGYKIFIVNKNLVKFFFGDKCYTYLHLPLDIYAYRHRKKRRRRIVFFSMNYEKLNDFFKYVINTKKIDYYERNNIFLEKNKIIYFKKIK